MALLLSTLSLSKSIASRQLFSGLSFGVEDREKIGLIGPNGAGKSTLLQILAGIQEPSAGSVSKRRDLTVGYVPQEDRFPDGETVNSALMGALSDLPLDETEKEIECQIMMGRIGFSDPDQLAGALSGGWKKRLSIAVALMKNPALLMMDEPTNHLDMEGILWLEDLVRQATAACLFVCHDRYFLEHAATRIIEISRNYASGYFSVSGSYSQFLTEREAHLEAQGRQEATITTKLRREIEWLRHGAPARSTKAQYRIDEAGRMMQDLSNLKERNAVVAGAKIDFTASNRKTKELLSASSISKSLGGKTLFTNLDLLLSPGIRLGLIGPNGGGKTSLIRTLTGELAPDSGEVKQAPNLNIVLFEQDRSRLDLKESLRFALSGDTDTVIYRGSSMHISAWAKRFGFQTQQLDSPVSALSGGERARILIARLMLASADLLILDEPGNDLDMQTLELLEESLCDFPGAMVLVSHDRFMLESVCTDILALNGEGDARYFASYSQWEKVWGRGSSAPVPTVVVQKKPQPEASGQKLFRGLTRPERRELDRMEEVVAAEEALLDEMRTEMTTQAVVTNYVLLQQVMEKAQAQEKKVESLYARWQELESKMSESA